MLEGPIKLMKSKI